MKKRKNALLLALAASLVLLAGCGKETSDITPTETGDITTEVHQPVCLVSADTVITCDALGYKYLTSELSMTVTVQFPRQLTREEYSAWLYDFEINGEPAGHTTEVMPYPKFDDPDGMVVRYTATAVVPREGQPCTVKCSITDDLTFSASDDGSYLSDEDDSEWGWGY